MRTTLQGLAREAQFPVGASVTIAELDRDPHPRLAALREREPVSWLPALGGWLVTRRDLTLAVMRDATAFTVDDPRFSTGQVVGPSMLTRDGAEHARHRDPFGPPFRLRAVRERFAEVVAAETERLVDAIEPVGAAELRSSVAGPLAVAVVAHALGLRNTDGPRVLEWYDAIVGAVTGVAAGQPVSSAGRVAFESLAESIRPALGRDPSSSLLAAAVGEAGQLSSEEAISNAAVLMFGGIETTEGMIANAAMHLLAHPEQQQLVLSDPALLPNAVEESLRLEPAAAVIDRYATRDVDLAGATIAAGDLVTVSIAGANRDPASFPDPDRFDVRRENVRHHIAFAHGPHVCIGLHLARMEAEAALAALLTRLPGLRLDPDRPPPAARGLVFRKPPELHAVWDSRREGGTKPRR